LREFGNGGRAMHELSIALSILEIAAEEAERQGGRPVAAVHVRLGPLAGVVKEALISAFDLAREDSPMGKAELVIEDVPLVVYCHACRDERTLPSVQLFSCPVCGAPTPEVVRGRELEVVALEIEE
jgi:hydrogenase nickel incorporation protein HypA/HybF